MWENIKIRTHFECITSSYSLRSSSYNCMTKTTDPNETMGKDYHKHIPAQLPYLSRLVRPIPMGAKMYARKNEKKSHSR